MSTTRSFGRKAISQPTRRESRTNTLDAFAPHIAPPLPRVAKMPVPVPSAPDLPSLDQELAEWKKTRKTGFQMPWRQISLMASLCFGIASLVLPDSVNDNVQWLLYGLMAISFVAGITRRRAKAIA